MTTSLLSPNVNKAISSRRIYQPASPLPPDHDDYDGCASRDFRLLLVPASAANFAALLVLRSSADSSYRSALLSSLHRSSICTSIAERRIQKVRSDVLPTHQQNTLTLLVTDANLKLVTSQRAEYLL